MDEKLLDRDLEMAIELSRQSSQLPPPEADEPQAAPVLTVEETTVAVVEEMKENQVPPGQALNLSLRLNFQSSV